MHVVWRNRQSDNMVNHKSETPFHSLLTIALMESVMEITLNIQQRSGRPVEQKRSEPARLPSDADVCGLQLIQRSEPKVVACCLAH
jgi:hypothetical protein